MSSINKAIILGRVGQEPEIRQTQSGKEVASFSIATSEKWKDKTTGENREATEWHRVVCFSEGLCRTIKNYVHKGSQILVEGQIKTRKWQDQSGQDKYTTEIVLQGYNANLVLLGGKGDGNAGAGHHDQQKADGYQPQSDDLDDEIVF